MPAYPGFGGTARPISERDAVDAVSCPTCKQPRRKWCVTATGARYMRVHVKRLRKASGTPQHRKK